MKLVLYKRSNGHYMRSLVKDTDTESDAPFGLPAGPPDIEQMDWDTIKREINRVLVDCGAFTWDEAQRHPTAIQSAVNVLKRHLIRAYRSMDIVGTNDS